MHWLLNGKNGHPAIFLIGRLSIFIVIQIRKFLVVDDFILSFSCSLLLPTFQPLPFSLSLLPSFFLFLFSICSIPYVVLYLLPSISFSCFPPSFFPAFLPSFI
uniref:Uncharacterized protein n=1 Tax=Cacopsylla melanoneura TaxID=428564 RepID=A0A8D8WKS3_9HEMI